MNKKLLIGPITAILVLVVIFGATYFVDEESDVTKRDDVVNVVTGVVELYQVHGEKSFDMITKNQDYLKAGQAYPFVMNGDLTEIVAHGFKPEVVGTPPSGLSDANISIPEMIDALDKDGTVWVQYTWDNPDTGTIDHKNSYLRAYDGYVFGSGFYIP